MQTNQLKQNIFTLIEKSEDVKILEMVYTILEQNYQLRTMVWDSLEVGEKEAINEGISQLERGEGISHEEVIKKINARFGI